MINLYSQRLPFLFYMLSLVAWIAPCGATQVKDQPEQDNKISQKKNLTNYLKHKYGKDSNIVTNVINYFDNAFDFSKGIELSDFLEDFTASGNDSAFKEDMTNQNVPDNKITDLIENLITWFKDPFIKKKRQITHNFLSSFKAKEITKDYLSTYLDACFNSGKLDFLKSYNDIVNDIQIVLGGENDGIPDFLTKQFHCNPLSSFIGFRSYFNRFASNMNRNKIKKHLVNGYLRKNILPKYFPYGVSMIIYNYLELQSFPSYKIEKETFFINLFPKYPNYIIICDKSDESNYQLRVCRIKKYVGFHQVSTMLLNKNKIENAIFCPDSSLVFRLPKSQLLLIKFGGSLLTLSKPEEFLIDTGYSDDTAFKMLYWRYNKLFTIPINGQENSIKSWDLSESAHKAAVEVSDDSTLSKVQGAIGGRTCYQNIFKNNFFTVSSDRLSDDNKYTLISKQGFYRLACHEKILQGSKAYCCFNAPCDIIKLPFHQFMITKACMKPYLCVHNKECNTTQHRAYSFNKGIKEYESLYALLPINHSSFRLITKVKEDQYRIYTMKISQYNNQLEKIDQKEFPKENYNLYKKELLDTGSYLLVRENEKVKGISIKK